LFKLIGALESLKSADGLFPKHDRWSKIPVRSGRLKPFSMKRVFTVLAAEDSSNLRAFVAHRLALPEGRAVQQIEAGTVFVDGRRCRAAEARLVGGQKVTVHDLPDPSTIIARQPQVVHRDHDLAVLDKPAGMPSTLTRRGGEQSVEQVAQVLLGERARLLHRLDKGASGLLVVTRSACARRTLQQQLARRILVRRYFALVHGNPSRVRWTVDRPLLKQASRVIVSPVGKAAVTHLQLLARAGEITLLVATLETGRMHQIRVHLASEGLPLLGDTRYGGPLAPRLALHAHCVRFVQPRGSQIEVHSPLPSDLRRLLPKPLELLPVLPDAD
jgi:RluA family pseudouridine synthase